jgi:hypothetical protein
VGKRWLQQPSVEALGKVIWLHIMASRVVHKTRRTATAEGRVYDEEGNLVAMGIGAFRIFERQGAPIV